MNISISIEEWYADPPIPSCGHPVYPITDGMGGVLAGCYFCEICSREPQYDEIRERIEMGAKALLDRANKVGLGRVYELWDFVPSEIRKAFESLSSDEKRKLAERLLQDWRDIFR